MTSKISSFMTFVLKIAGASVAGTLLYLGFDSAATAWLAVVSFVLLMRLLETTHSSVQRCVLLTFMVFTFVFMQFAFLVVKAQTEGWADLIVNVAIAVIYLIPLYCVSFVRTKYYVEITLIGWLLAELLFVYLPIGNQLFQLGIIPANFTIAVQWYGFTGIFFGSLWVLMVSYLVYQAIFHRRYIFALASVVVMPFAVSLILYHADNCDFVTRRVAILPLAQNKDAASAIDILWSWDLQQIDYVVMPEGVVTFSENAVEVNPIMTGLKRLIGRNADISVMMGVFTYASNACDNSVVILSHDDTFRRYKSLKIPFSEYLPYPDIIGNIGFIRNNVPCPLTEKRNQTELYVHGKDTIAPLICYEALSTGYVCELVRHGADIFFVASSNSYIDNRHIEHINVNIIRANAITSGRSFIRSVENGISCFISSDGSVDAVTKYKTELISRDVDFNSRISFYVCNERFVNAIYGIMLCIVLGLLIYFGRKLSSVCDLK